MITNRSLDGQVHLAQTSASLRTGYASAQAHHGEILQGVVAGGDGRPHRILVSLSCVSQASEALFVLENCKHITVEPAWKIKSSRAADLTLEYGNSAQRGGRLQIRSKTPVCWGLGSSTSDVTATICAVADALGVCLSAEVVARLAVKAEIASDSLMFIDRAVLFAQREGAVIEDFGGAIPPLAVLGLNTDQTGRGVDTLKLKPARYSWWEIEAFRPLVGLMRQAVRTQDAKLVGQVASASARINQRFLPKPHFDELEKLVNKVDALGIQVAHSGTIVGLIFDPESDYIEQQIHCAREYLSEMGFRSIWRFQTNDRHGAILG